MTERLYYQDPSLCRFDATIVAVFEHKNRHVAVLDRTAFYPTSGGQAHDTGLLNHVQIVDVREGPDSAIWHISARPVGAVGDRVQGTIDAERRHRHSQMHTAQHLLSQAFVRLFNYQTVSVHLGEEYGAVEFETAEIPDDQLAEAERLVQRTVESNLPIEILFVPHDELDRYRLRRPTDRSGIIRLISIGDFECTACGGTHCRSTGEVGLVKIIGTEKIRGRAMIRFLVGREAADDYRMRFDVTSELISRFTCHVTDLPDAFDRLTDENRSLKAETNRLQKELIPAWISKLGACTEKVGRHRLAVAETDLFNNRNVRALVEQAAAHIKGVVLLATANNLVLAVDRKSGLVAGDLVKRLCQATGLKGGGGVTLAHIGGSDQAKLSSYTQVLREILSHV